MSWWRIGVVAPLSGRLDPPVADRHCRRRRVRRARWEVPPLGRGGVAPGQVFAYDRHAQLGRTPRGAILFNLAYVEFECRGRLASYAVWIVCSEFGLVAGAGLHADNFLFIS